MAGAVVATCAEYVEAAHSPTNDCTIGRRKVYGSAQVEWDKAFVQSGTFLVSTDCVAMAKTLRPSQLKFRPGREPPFWTRVLRLMQLVRASVFLTRQVPRNQLDLKPTRKVSRHLCRATDRSECRAGPRTAYVIARLLRPAPPCSPVDCLGTSRGRNTRARLAWALLASAGPLVARNLLRIQGQDLLEGACVLLDCLVPP